MQRVAFKDTHELSYAANEAINTLYTNITFLGEEKKKIMLTSCHASEGKSFISMQLAITMAKMGKKVVLVDCDLRKSQVARDYLQMDFGSVKGTSHYLAGMATLDDILIETTLPNLYVVPCTKTISNSLPLVSSSRLQTLLDSLAEYMDYVVVDTPPVGLLIDAAKIATYCDGVLMVVGYNSVRRRELADAIRQLEQSNCPILGTVINQADFRNYVGRKYYYNKYYYNSYYYEDSGRK